MVFLDAATGLRRSELLALKWEDVDFERLHIKVRRSIYLSVVGNCKTEASRKPVPMDLTLASELWSWKQDCGYRQPSDWLFASPHSRGRNPYWPDIVLSRVIRPAAARAGIRTRIGWHTFRHSFSSMLIANGENVKVVQELMRHASCRCTLEIYSQARIQAKREITRVVEMILPKQQEVNGITGPLIPAKVILVAQDCGGEGSLPWIETSITPLEPTSEQVTASCRQPSL